MLSSASGLWGVLGRHDLSMRIEGERWRCSPESMHWCCDSAPVWTGWALLTHPHGLRPPKPRPALFILCVPGVPSLLRTPAKVLSHACSVFLAVCLYLPRLPAPPGSTNGSLLPCALPCLPCASLIVPPSSSRLPSTLLVLPVAFLAKKCHRNGYTFL